MEGMTDKQFRFVLELIIELIKSSLSIEEAVSRVKEAMKKASIAE